VDGVDGGSRVAFTMWIEDSDGDAAGAAPHDLDVAALADPYSNVFAAHADAG
jgi:hypothetical protein